MCKLGFSNKRRYFLCLSFLLFFVSILISCGGKEGKDTSVYKDRATFENYLSERINSYVENCSSDLIDSQTNIFTLQPVRMFKHSFFEEDSIRKDYWYQIAIEKGLNNDSIIVLINREIDIFNTYHKEATIESINIAPLYQDDVIDEMSFSLIKKLELFGTYDLIDIILGSFISYGVGYVFGWIIGFLFVIIFPSSSDESVVVMAKSVGWLFFVIQVLLFFWLTYKYIVISLELENVISSNVISNLLF